MLTAAAVRARIAGDRRADKVDKLRKAKVEAQAEIDKFKETQEVEYQKRIADGSTSGSSTFVRLQEETNAAIGQVQMELGKKKDKVSSLLVDYVVQV